METSRHGIRILLAGALLLALLAAARPATSIASDAGLGGARALPATPAGAIADRVVAATPPSAPSPPPTPVPPSPKSLLFSSDFTQGLLDWSLGGVGEATPQVLQGAEGPYCEFTLNGSQERSELIMGDELHITEDQTVLYEFEEFIVPGFAYGSKALGWNIFTQFKSDGEGSPMLALDLWDEGGKTGLWVEPEPGPNYYVAPMAEGVWHRVSMQITASSAGAGGWVVYLDGQEVDRKRGMDTIRPGKTFAYIKNGLYRSGPTINANSRLRLRNVSLSTVS
ncbi:MAG: heparin lyase I family protein [Solirubrobacterales bacterium]